jgi:hypothetical protein
VGSVFVRKLQIELMKVVGIVLIIIGIGVFIFQGIRSSKREKVLDVGPVEITKQVERSDSWQLYAGGGIAVVAGFILVLADRKKGTG